MAGRRHAMAAAMVVGLLALTACGSGDEASPTDAASSAAPTASDGSALSVAATNACAAYFELDLLNSNYAGGAVADGDITEAKAKADFARLLRVMVSQGNEAQSDGSLGTAFVANATKMRKAVRSLGGNEALSDLTTAQQARFARQSTRVERACEAAGFPLPDDNITARTAAGV